MSAAPSFSVFAAAALLAADCSRSAEAGPAAAKAASPDAGARRPLPLNPLEKIYAGGLMPEWQNYGWAEGDLKGPGPAKVDFSNRAGWIIAAPGLRDGPSLRRRFGGVAFRYQAPADFGEFLEVRLSLQDSDFDSVKLTPAHLTAQADGWTQVLVPMRELNPHGQAFDRLRIRATRSVGSTRVQLDQIALTVPGSEPDEKVPYPSREARGVVHCERPGSPISPYIYGVSAAQAPDEGLRAGAHRWGGNTTSRFNWQLGDTWNTGSDWYFQNVKREPFSAFLQLAQQRKVFTAITVPTLGWVAKDGDSYSFSVKELGAQKDADPQHPDRGNGEKPDGSPLPSPAPTRTSVAAPPDFVGAWVKSIRQADEAQGGTVREYILDNEPALWDSTHRDVHPEPVGYDELYERTVKYGAAVRAADPKAVIAGPAEWGWPGYFYSAKDAKAGFRSKPDRKAHGDVPLLAWWLQRLAEHEKKTGQRVLDVVDVHFYPQGKNVFTNGGGGGADLETAKLRLRSTRALWDKSYTDESWIKEPVFLIPRLKQLIAENYPGRGISIGEWNFGAEQHISGGLALAEALGRFAEGGLHSAYYWTRPQDRSPAWWAFRAFRNYDGRGAAFFDSYVPSDAAAGTSLFVSRDAKGKKLVVVALNLENQTSADLKLDLSSCGALSQARAFTYDGAPEGLVESKPSSTAGAKSFSALLQPWSINVFELSL
ncbi:MAG: glycosyl hydrolase [Archangiaceae bacterium]|nr:glycosyl hydrolase [Archangiaceae bacterium]